MYTCHMPVYSLLSQKDEMPLDTLGALDAAKSFFLYQMACHE